MESLYQFMQKQLDVTKSQFIRYKYDDIHWQNRMLALVGPRGVGKTTLFLQHIKRHHSLRDTLYVTTDHLYFTTHTLFETAETFNKNGGKYFFIDEVHKYSNWSQELKLMYDAFPDLHVYFTGSSILDIEKGEADLSRRAPKYLMQGLSFREFLAIRHQIKVPVFSLEQILNHEAKIPEVSHPLVYFKEYLKEGYYPFGQDPDFEMELNQVITRTIEVDIPQYANMNIGTAKKLKKLLVILAGLVPYKPNMTSLGGQIQASRNNVEDYLTYLEKAGLLAQLKDGTGGLGELGKVEKIYLDNTNLMFALGSGQQDSGTVRETFFFNQMRVNQKVTSSPISDFEIQGKTFEVGGKGKSKKQLTDAKEGYVVKDDIEYGYGNVIPLWAFGLNY
ncbi:MAG: AAA family ATPase [Bacteroidales bacterium]|nr:AAA family ATPase [Bacteroidales bacterium]